MRLVVENVTELNQLFTEFNEISKPEADNQGFITLMLDRLAGTFEATGALPTLSEHTFMALAGRLVGLEAKHFRQTFNQWYDFMELVVRKHAAYGSKPLLAWGLIGILIRIDSKWQRFANLSAKPMTDDVHESTRDTLMDLIGYCMLAILIIRKGMVKL